MTENYHKWFSQYIGKEYEMLVFGEKGTPVVFFPPAAGRYYSAKDYGLVGSLDIEKYDFKFYTLDSYDQESWYNFTADPPKRVAAYKHFENLLIHDVLAFTRYETHNDKAVLCGAGFGGYHALNFGLKHPEMAAGIITLDGEFDIRPCIFGYYDDDCYFNNPVDYLPGLQDPWYIDRLREVKIVMFSGDKTAEQNISISAQLRSKKIDHKLIRNSSGADWESWKAVLPGLLTSVLSDLGQ